MKNINFNKIDLIVSDIKKGTVLNIADGIVYTCRDDGSYPTINLNGFSVCRFKRGDYRVNRIDSISPSKHKTLKSALSRIYNYGKTSFNVLDLLN